MCSYNSWINGSQINRLCVGADGTTSIVLVVRSTTTIDGTHSMTSQRRSNSIMYIYISISNDITIADALNADVRHALETTKE